MSVPPASVTRAASARLCAGACRLRLSPSPRPLFAPPPPPPGLCHVWRAARSWGSRPRLRGCPTAASWRRSGRGDAPARHVRGGGAWGIPCPAAASRPSPRIFFPPPTAPLQSAMMQQQGATPDGPSAGAPPPSPPPVTVSDAATVRRMYEQTVENYEACFTPEELARPLYTVTVPRLATRAAAAAAASTGSAGDDGATGAAPRALRLLDVGCGPGHVLEILSRTATAASALDDDGGGGDSGGHEPASPAPPPPTLVGVDLSPHMVARARARVPAATVIEAPLADLAAAVTGEAGDAPFDGLACTFVLHHVGSLPPVLATFRRLLRPGGAALLASWVSPDGGRMEGYPEEWPIDAVAHRTEAVTTAAAAAGLRVDAVDETVDEEMGASFAVWECTAVATEGA